MTQEHPITPPPELVEQWSAEIYEQTACEEITCSQHIATQAARWGADQELEACCKWLGQFDYDDYSYGDRLKAARRSCLKPPSLKEQALQALEEVDDTFDINDIHHEAIRRALESLPN
jgi:hypothetical protein